MDVSMRARTCEHGRLAGQGLQVSEYQEEGQGQRVSAGGALTISLVPGGLTLTKDEIETLRRVAGDNDGEMRTTNPDLAWWRLGALSLLFFPRPLTRIPRCTGTT